MTVNVAKNEKEWDAFVLEHGGGFLQSWGWSHFQEALGRNVYRYVLDEPAEDEEKGQYERTVAQFLLIEHGLPFGKKYIYIPWGPVIRADVTDLHEKMETVTVALREAVRREGAIFARSDFPFVQKADILKASDLVALGFKKVRSVQPSNTVIVDLQDDEEVLLAAMHQKTRYNIRLATKHGVEIREAEYGNAHLLKHDKELFWRILSETASRDNFHTHEKNYYDKMIEVLSEKKRSGCTVKLMFAVRNGEALAAGLFAYYGDTVTYLHGASLSSERKYMAPYLLHWEVMRNAKEKGYKRYDLWGVAPENSEDHPWAGITRFKKGFGGNQVGYLGTWELPTSSVWYKLYRLAKRLR